MNKKTDAEQKIKRIKFYVNKSKYGKREIWLDRKQAKDYFIKLMMRTYEKDHKRNEGVYI